MKNLMPDGHSVRKSLSYMPWTATYDNGRHAPLALMARESGIHRSTLVHAVRRGKLDALRDSRGRILVRIKSFTEYFLRYRGRGGGNRCKRWSAREIEILMMPLTDREASAAIGRSPLAVRLKRMRLKGSQNV